MAGAAPAVKSYSLWLLPKGERAALQSRRGRQNTAAATTELLPPPPLNRCRLAAQPTQLAPVPSFLPAAPLSDKLHAEVRRLAAAVPGAPTFLPHVTLLGGVRTTEADMLERAHTLSAQLKVTTGCIHAINQRSGVWLADWL